MLHSGLSLTWSLLIRSEIKCCCSSEVSGRSLVQNHSAHITQPQMLVSGVSDTGDGSKSCCNEFVLWREKHKFEQKLRDVSDPFSSILLSGL